MTTPSFSMTRTFADIVIGRNKEKHYTAPEAALADLATYLRRFREQGNDIAFLSVRILTNILTDPETFSGGILNTDHLRTKLSNFHYFEDECNKAYDNRREQQAKLVYFFSIYPPKTIIDYPFPKASTMFRHFYCAN